MKDDILIINNKRYVHTPEVNKRNTLWVIRNPDLKGYTARVTREELEKLNLFEGYNQPFEVLIPKGNEIIVSEDDAYLALSSYMHTPYLEKDNNYKLFLECLGFKKDGV